MESREKHSCSPAVIVNADNIMALSAIRSLGRQGIPVIAIFGKRNFFEQYSRIIRSSRFISKIYYFYENNYENNLVSQLIKTGRSLGSKAVLFPVSDYDMIIISSNRELLEEFYHILMPPHDMLETLLHKELFYKFSNKNNLPIPRTFFPAEINDIENIAEKVNYPCIIKPSWRDDLWIKTYKNKKVLVVENSRELKQTFHKTFSLFRKLVVQDIISGPENNILCTFTYLDIHSETLGIFVCRKIRQFPPYYGNTALAESVLDEKVIDLTKSICKQLGLVGYVSIEFKKDEKDNSYKIIEITPCRLNRQAGLADALGVNIPNIWYCYLLKKPIPQINSYKTHCKWMSEVNEMRALPFYLKDVWKNILRWLRSYKNIKQFEVLAKDDLMPSLMLLLLLLLYPRYVCSQKRR